MNHKKELLRGLWVSIDFMGTGCQQDAAQFRAKGFRVLGLRVAFALLPKA